MQARTYQICPLNFFDMVYLRIFVILSPAFDSCFYQTKPPTNIVEEAAFARKHFRSLLHIFSKRFFIHLEGDILPSAYVVDWMLAEFAAASVVFINSICECQGEVYDNGDTEYGVTSTSFRQSIEDILQRSFP